MTRNILFPINNKGGVGKTSILTDVVTALAQRHTVGIIDFDDQASLAGTLQSKDLACRPLEECSLDVSNIMLTPATRFGFSDSLGSLAIDVEAIKAQLSVFPAGMLYDFPEKQKRLERIVNTEMGATSFFALDLPPIPHPGMILDYTLLPIIKACKDDVRLFPLLVATPDHNVIDIALRGYAKIERYLQENGVPRNKIHPIFVLNKVPVEIGESEKPATTFDTDISRKLNALGILYISPSWNHGQINHINSHFDYNGSRYKSVVFPFLTDIRDGQFSLLFGKELQLHQYPHLVEMVRAHNFQVSADNNPRDRIYMYSLHQVINHIVAQANSKPKKNYTKTRVVFDKEKITDDVVIELRELLDYYYETGESKYTERITQPLGGSSTEVWYNVPRTTTPEWMAKILLQTQSALNPSLQLNAESIEEALTKETYPGFTENFNIYDVKGLQIVGVAFKNETTIKLAFLRKPKEVSKWGIQDIPDYLQKVDVFLSQLSRLKQ
jgi:hypothetical protein